MTRKGTATCIKLVQPTGEKWTVQYFCMGRIVEIELRATSWECYSECAMFYDGKEKIASFANYISVVKSSLITKKDLKIKKPDIKQLFENSDFGFNLLDK